MENEIVVEPLGRPRNRVRSVLRDLVLDLEKIDGKIRSDRKSIVAIVPNDFDTRVSTIIS